ILMYMGNNNIVYADIKGSPIHQPVLYGFLPRKVGYPYTLSNNGFGGDPNQMCRYKLEGI
ncbi:hypothetical protein TorRG33x02_091510, partial [Trema orientale]